MDTTLQGTLGGTLPANPVGFTPPTLTPTPSPKNYNKIGDTTKINDQNIKTLEGAQRTESQMADFQKIMSMTSRKAYEERQTQELNSVKGQFDPTKVSGGVFSSIIGNLEKERGTDVSKIGQTHMNVYRETQAEVTKRLDYLQNLREKKRQFMTDYKYSKVAANKLLTGKDNALKRLKADKSDFNRQYIQDLQKAGTDTSYMDFSASEIKQSIQALLDKNYARHQIVSALNDEGIPTFPGSVAGNLLS